MTQIKRTITLVNKSVMEWRCKNCHALLGKFTHANGQIKCKCGTMNELNLVSQKALLTDNQQ